MRISDHFGCEYAVKDISELHTAKNADGMQALLSRGYQCARYEIDKLRPNYGASSDILRYIILIKHNVSTYFDSDVMPRVSLFYNIAKNSLTKWMQDQGMKEGNILFVKNNSQGITAIGNDTLFVRYQGNEALQKLLEELVNNYGENFFKKNIDFGITVVNFAYSYNDDRVVTETANSSKCRATLHLTGPALVRQIVATDIDCPDILTGIYKDKTDLFPLEFLETQPEEQANDGNWLKTEPAWLKKVNFLPPNDQVYFILDKCKNCIQFEIDAWGVFLIDDYYRDGIILLSDNPQAIQDFKENFFIMMQALYKDNYEKIDVIKISFRYDATINFLEKINGGYLFKEKEFDREKYRELVNFFLDQHDFLNTVENQNYLAVDQGNEKEALVRF